MYERDILLWSQDQADLLRRLAAGERVNAAIDWNNLIVEVEDLGRSLLHACASHIRQALVHLLKLRAWPQSRSAGQWRAEVIAFLSDAAQEFSPSMRQRIDLARLYSRAVMSVRSVTDDSGESAALPDECPYTLDDLLGEDVTALWAESER